VLAVSAADACIVIGRQQATANVRWANNTVTTNGVIETASLTIVSIVGRRVASLSRTHFPPEQIEAMVHECEARCKQQPEAPDYMPLLERDGDLPGWSAAPAAATVRVLDPAVPKMAAMFERARRSDVQTFGYAEHGASTIWIGSSTGLRRRHADHTGKVEITAKTPDFSRSSWAGSASYDFAQVDSELLFDTLRQRLAWSEHRIDLPAGHYEVLLEPSCTADLAISAYYSMARRDADEGRSPFSSPAGGTRIGERIFGPVSLYSDPHEAGIATTPFCVSVGSGSVASVFDNGLRVERTEWTRDGTLLALVMPRYWAAKVNAPAAVPYVNNLIVPGSGPTLEEMIRTTERALLVTCFWYIRTVDPQTALLTGLTRDGVFLVENGKVKGAVNNFRWNMSPITAFAQAIEVGRAGPSLPREHDEFLRAKAPPMRLERFNMSSVSEAT
jgi:predicted Zn-dependent protease